MTIDYLILGHMTADIVPNDRWLGGTVSYAAPAAKAFGRQVGIVTSARDDDPLLAELRQNSEVVNIPADVTTTFENVYKTEGRVQYLHKIARPILFEDIPEAWRSAKFVHLAPLVNELDPKIAESFPQARIMATPQGWIRKWGDDKRVRFKPWFDVEALKLIDIVVMSVEDIHESPDMEEKFVPHVQTLVITDGAKGGRYYVDGQRYEYDAVPVDVVDLTGAGDIFATALFASLANIDDIHLAVKMASRMAGISTTRTQLNSAPTPQEIETAYRELMG